MLELLLLPERHGERSPAGGRVAQSTADQLRNSSVQHQRKLSKARRGGTQLAKDDAGGVLPERFDDERIRSHRAVLARESFGDQLCGGSGLCRARRRAVGSSGGGPGGGEVVLPIQKRTAKDDGSEEQQEQ